MLYALIVGMSLIAMSVDLKIDWASHDSAKYACLNWHYSKCMPVGKIIKVGVWENLNFIGVVLFSRGANKDVGKPYGCSAIEVCELTRVALKSHITPVSKIISIAIKFLKIKSEGIRLIVSFADKEQGHHGGIYQAGNWIYAGETLPADEYLYKGKRWHGRAFRKSHGSHLNFIEKGLKVVSGSSKHRYLMPLTTELKEQLLTVAKSYPKRVKKHDSGDQLEVGGALPTNTLHISGGTLNANA